MQSSTLARARTDASARVCAAHAVAVRAPPPAPPSKSSHLTAASRFLAGAAASAILLTTPAAPVLAEGLDIAGEPSVALEATAPKASKARQVYMNFSVNEKKAGKVVIELYEDVSPAATDRFYDLAMGKQGVGYRKTKIATVGTGYVSSEPLRSLTFGDVASASPITGGDSVVDLVDAMEARAHSHDAAGQVSFIVKPDKEVTRSEKLVAVGGELRTVVTEDGDVPNGTAFVITTAAAPQLDATNLVVGRVVEGMEVINEIDAIPAVKENSGSAFFKAAKAAGDKRATVAEKGFNRPFARVAIMNSGVVTN